MSPALNVLQVALANERRAEVTRAETARAAAAQRSYVARLMGRRR